MGFDPRRRRFLTDSVRTAVGVGLVAVTLGVYQRQARALPFIAIRPPGAGDERAFQSSCIRCGLFVRDCPYDTLKLAEVGEEVALGTPYYKARDVPCEMCDDIPCVKACPTGALDPALTAPRKLRAIQAVSKRRKGTYEQCDRAGNRRVKLRIYLSGYRTHGISTLAITSQTNQNI